MSLWPNASLAIVPGLVIACISQVRSLPHSSYVFTILHWQARSAFWNRFRPTRSCSWLWQCTAPFRLWCWLWAWSSLPRTMWPIDTTCCTAKSNATTAAACTGPSPFNSFVLLSWPSWLRLMLRFWHVDVLPGHAECLYQLCVDLRYCRLSCGLLCHSAVLDLHGEYVWTDLQSSLTIRFRPLSYYGAAYPRLVESDKVLTHSETYRWAYQHPDLAPVSKEEIERGALRCAFFVLWPHSPVTDEPEIEEMKCVSVNIENGQTTDVFIYWFSDSRFPSRCSFLEATSRPAIQRWWRGAEWDGQRSTGLAAGGDNGRCGQCDRKRSDWNRRSRRCLSNSLYDATRRQYDLSESEFEDQGRNSKNWM